jgi:hypothetical protein
MYGITVEALFFLIGIAVFLVAFAAGTLIWRKKLLIYSSISWAVISSIVGIFSLWPRLLALEEVFYGIQGNAPSLAYYIIGSLQGQTAVSLAVLALCVSREAKNQFLSVFIRLCLIFSWVVILVYIGDMVFGFPRSAEQHLRIFCILFNIVPVSAFIALILFILKEKQVLPIIFGTIALGILTVAAYWGSTMLIFSAHIWGSKISLIAVLIFDVIWLATIKFWPLKNIHIKIALTLLVLAFSAAFVRICIMTYMFQGFGW